jgi:hypothetical protein
VNRQRSRQRPAQLQGFAVDRFPENQVTLVGHRQLDAPAFEVLWARQKHFGIPYPQDSSHIPLLSLDWSEQEYFDPRKKKYGLD